MGEQLHPDPGLKELFTDAHHAVAALPPQEQELIKTASLRAIGAILNNNKQALESVLADSTIHDALEHLDNVP